MSCVFFWLCFVCGVELVLGGWVVEVERKGSSFCFWGFWSLAEELGWSKISAFFFLFIFSCGELRGGVFIIGYVCF